MGGLPAPNHLRVGHKAQTIRVHALAADDAVTTPCVDQRLILE